jgi:FtsP/CotA-like multicopper oxidase with cupredoxin domain
MFRFRKEREEAIMCDRRHTWFRVVFLTLFFLAIAASTASAVVIDLCAGKTTMTMPDGRIIPVWGFGLNQGGACTPSVPGPVLDVTDGSLTINLTNNLPEPTSLHILGQQLSNNSGPVWTDLPADTVVSSGSRPFGNYSARIRSFSHETAANGGTAVYTWNSFKPGTFLLQGGTNPAKQVQMGLYAAVKKDFSAGQAYGGPQFAFNQQLVLLFHEIDPAIHDAVDQNQYGAVPGATITSSIHREAKYFLINGKSYNPALPDGGGLDPINASTPVAGGEKVLLRLLNAGLGTHVPQILNMSMTVVAEDGAPYTHTVQNSAVELPASKTTDVIITPGAGRFPLFDARLNLTNAGSATPGGMLAYLLVNSPNARVLVADSNPAPASKGILPSRVRLKADKKNVRGTGTPITYTALAFPAGGAYEYRFSLEPAGGRPSVVQQYSKKRKWNWVPAKVGKHVIRVDVRRVGSSADNEATTSVSYRIRP